MKILETITRGRPVVEQVRIGKRKDFGERLCEVHARIACRAYEISESRGRTGGRDLEDWLEAEQELFYPLPAELIEGESSFLVRADVDGFRSADLEIHAEPRKLFLLGKKIAKGTPWRSERIGTGRGEVELYRVIDLPAEVNPTMMAAHIKNGVLEVYLLKAGVLRWPEAASRAA
jgi:HSP20 family molecular chaperone IbpA